jgi:hypothetical protein
VSHAPLTLLTLLSAQAADDCPTCAITKVRGNYRTIHTEITIDAPPEQVWAVLTDWGALSEWSPTIQGVTGAVSDGAVVMVDYVHPGNGKLLHTEHTFLVEAGVSYGRSDPVIGGVTDNHHYRIEALPDGRTRLVQDDVVDGGLLARLLLGTFMEFNTALKERVESQAD